MRQPTTTAAGDHQWHLVDMLYVWVGLWFLVIYNNNYTLIIPEGLSSSNNIILRSETCGFSSAVRTSTTFKG